MTVINNYTTWQQLLQLVNVQQNGQIPPSVFIGWYNEASKQIFKDLAEQFQLNQIISDLLSPYQKIQLIQAVPQPGQNWSLIPYPSDYQYFVGATILTQQQEDECFSASNLPIIDDDGKSKRYTDPDFAQMAANYAGANIVEGIVWLIDSARWPAALESKTKGPTLKKPKAVQYQGGFKVAPKGIASVLLYYLTTPQDSIFSYTVSAQDILIYNAGASTQLQWSDQILPWMLAILTINYGGYVNDPGIIKMGEDMLELAKK